MIGCPYWVKMFIFICLNFIPIPSQECFIDQPYLWVHIHRSLAWIHLFGEPRQDNLGCIREWKFVVLLQSWTTSANKVYIRLKIWFKYIMRYNTVYFVDHIGAGTVFSDIHVNNFLNLIANVIFENWLIPGTIVNNFKPNNSTFWHLRFLSHNIQ